MHTSVEHAHAQIPDRKMKKKENNFKAVVKISKKREIY